MIASLVLFAAMVARAPLSTTFPNHPWTLDLVGFVLLPVTVLAIAARTTGWSWRRLCGFELRPPGSMFGLPRWAAIGVAAFALAVADLILSFVLIIPVHLLQQMAQPAIPSVKSLIAAAPVKWLALAYMCLTAGIVEEILYRGLTAHYFLDREHPRAALYILVTTAMFTLGHWGRGPGTMLLAFATGLLFGAWFVRTRDLATLVAAHVLVDVWWFK